MIRLLPIPPRPMKPPRPTLRTVCFSEQSGGSSDFSVWAYDMRGIRFACDRIPRHGDAPTSTVSDIDLEAVVDATTPETRFVRLSGTPAWAGDPSRTVRERVTEGDFLRAAQSALGASD